jgi:hypothetical protein
MWRNGSRTRLRIWRRKAWGFESLHPHHKAEKAFQLILEGFFRFMVLKRTTKEFCFSTFILIQVPLSLPQMPAWRNWQTLRSQKPLV